MKIIGTTHYGNFLVEMNKYEITEITRLGLENILKLEKFDALIPELKKIHLEENEYLTIEIPHNAEVNSMWEFMDLFEKKFPELSKRTIVIKGETKIYISHRNE